MNLLSFGVSYGEDAELHRVCCLHQFPTAGNDGGSCCAHVVYDEQMLVFEAFCLASSRCVVGRKGKDILHVDVAFPSVLVCLAFGESLSCDEMFEYGNLCGFVQSSRYGLALVVASLSFSFGARGIGTMASMPSKKCMLLASLASKCPMPVPTSSCWLYLS